MNKNRTRCVIKESTEKIKSKIAENRNYIDFLRSKLETIEQSDSVNERTIAEKSMTISLLTSLNRFILNHDIEVTPDLLINELKKEVSNQA